MPLHVSNTVVLVIRRSKFYYTASGIITPVGDRPVHRLKEITPVGDRPVHRLKEITPVGDRPMHRLKEITPVGDRPVHRLKEITPVGDRPVYTGRQGSHFRWPSGVHR